MNCAKNRANVSNQFALDAKHRFEFHKFSITRSTKTLADRMRFSSDNRQVSVRWLTTSTTNRLENLPDCVDHKLRLLLVDFVAAIRISDVLRVRHKLGKLLLRFFLRGVGDVTEVWRNVTR